jgi:hypothetical protein
MTPPDPGFFRRCFLSHPHGAGESYSVHMRFALGVAARLIRAGLCLVVHAFIPCLHERTASTCILSLADMLRERQARPHPPARP